MYKKLIELYPELANFDFASGVITIQNDSDGKGDYIAKWEHPTLTRPTEDEIKALVG